MPVLVIALNSIASIVMVTILFAAVFKVLPDVTMRWKDVWVGALMTALLFVSGKEIIAWYLQRSQIGFSWGSAASSMVSLLIWVYYTSLIVLFGAELTQVWSNRFGSGTRPTSGAARMVQETHRVHDQPPLDGDSGPITSKSDTNRVPLRKEWGVPKSLILAIIDALSSWGVRPNLRAAQIYLRTEPMPWYGSLPTSTIDGPAPCGARPTLVTSFACRKREASLIQIDKHGGWRNVLAADHWYLRTTLAIRSGSGTPTATISISS